MTKDSNLVENDQPPPKTTPNRTNIAPEGGDTHHQWLVIMVGVGDGLEIEKPKKKEKRRTKVICYLIAETKSGTPLTNTLFLINSSSSRTNLWHHQPRSFPTSSFGCQKHEIEDIGHLGLGLMLIYDLKGGIDPNE